MTPDRHASEDALVRAHLHLATSAARELARRLPAHVNRDDVHRATVLNYESIVAEGEADDLLPSGDRAPDHVLVDRERRADLADAALALPERLRAVVIGFFYQERPMLERAAEAGLAAPTPA
jgi:RNA polymerase sigma factor for flagellar operon FliA